MKQGDDLFQLCRSLKKGERSAFARWAGKGMGGHDLRYLELYDVMLKISPTEIKDVPKMLGLKKGSTYSMLRGYLFDQILRFLAASQAQSQIKPQLRRFMDQANVLRTRNLFEAAKKVLRKARKLAEHHEEYTYLIEIAQMQTILALDTGNIKEMDARTKEAPDQIQGYLTQLSGFFRIMNAYAFLAEWLKNRGQSPSLLQAQHDKIEQYLQEPDGAELCTTNQLLAGTIRGIIASIEGAPEPARAARMQVHQTFQAHPQFISQRLTQYSANLYNLACSALLTKDFELTENCIEELFAVETNSKRRAKKEYLKLTKLRAHQLAILLNTIRNEWELVIATHSAVKAMRKPQDSALVVEYFNAIDLLSVFAFLFLGRESEGLPVLNSLIAASPPELRFDRRVQAHLLCLVIHDKMENRDLLDYLLRNTQRILKDGRPLSDFESQLLGYIRHKQAAPTGQKSIQVGHENFILATTQFESIASLDRFDWQFGYYLIRKFIADHPTPA